MRKQFKSKKIISLGISLMVVGCTTALPVTDDSEVTKSGQSNNISKKTETKEHQLNFEGIDPTIKKMILKMVEERKKGNPQLAYRNSAISLYGNNTQPEVTVKTGDFAIKTYTSFGNEYRMNTSTSNDQQRPDIGINSSGNGLVVWGGDGDIHARKVVNFIPSGNDFRVNQNTSGDQEETRASIDSNGNGLIVWEDQRNGDDDVYARKIVNFAVTGGDFRINQQTNQNYEKPIVSLNSSGDGLVVWEQQVTDSTNLDLYARKIVNYAPTGGDFRLNEVTTNHQHSPKMSLNSNGDGIVVWEDERLSDEDVYGRRIVNYAVSGSEFIVNQTTNDEMKQPDIHLDEFGNGMAVWEDERNGNEDIYARRIINYIPTGNDYMINSIASDKQETPRIDLDDGGNGLVVWRHKVGSNEDVYAREIVNFQPVGSDFLVNEATGTDQSLPTVSLNGSGRGIVVWEDNRNSSDDIYAREILSDGCPDVSSGRPTSPTVIFSDDYATASPTFGDTGNGSTDWTQWGGDYYKVPAGVALWNPGPGLGVRDVPGEYIAERPGLLETGIFRKVPLNFSTGDKLVAKINVASTFTDNDSDSTIVLFFDDPASTIAVSNTLRNSTSQELMVEAIIPNCTTKVTFVALGYLGFNETTSLTFENMSLEQVPANFYTQTTLLDEPLDASADNAYGTNSPANVDEEFNYDMYLVDSHPLKYGGDKAVTVDKGSASGFGGMVKQVNLGSYNPGDKVTAFIYGATTFTDSSSEALLKMEFYDASDTLLDTQISSKLNGNNYRWLTIDRADIPANSTYLKLVPTVNMGASETSSMLWDDMKVYLMQP